MSKAVALVIAATAFLPNVPSGCVAGTQYSAPLPQLKTEELVNTMRVLTDSFTRLEGHRPSSLEEACLGLRPTYGRHGSPPRCSYWLHDGDSIPLDGWRNPLHYEVAGARVSIMSAGPDGRLGTADDMGFDSEQERTRVAAAAGCYRVDFHDWKQFPGNVMRLDTIYRGRVAYRAAPVIESYFTPRWLPSPYPFSADSVFVIWQAVEHGVHFHFRVYTDSLAGSASGSYRRPHVRAERVPCST